MTIYSLQFPSIDIHNRSHFIDFVQKNIIETALKKQDDFMINGHNAQYFHKSRHNKGFTPVRIHSLYKDDILMVRAYGDKATETLKYWSHIFLQKYPEYNNHIIEQREFWQLKQVNTPLYYSSNNWIPFNKCIEKNGIFYDENSRDITSAMQSRLVGNIRTFFKSIEVDNSDINTQIEIVDYPREENKTLAIKKNINGSRQSLYKSCFEIKIKSNVTLPSIFSIGQNVGYGSGVFMKCK